MLRLHSNQSDEDAPHGVLFHILCYEICNRMNTEIVIWNICCVLCVATGFPACVLILRKMSKPRQSGTPLTPNSLFILHLTIMDTIFLTTIPFGLLNHMTFRLTIVELVWNSLHSLNICGRPLIMTCMCLDCYLAVVHPITYHKRKSMTPRIVMVCLVWACSFAFAVMLFIYPQISGMASLGPFVITTVVVGISDSFILCALLKSDAGKKNIHQQKKRAIHTLVNSLVMTVLFYSTPILLAILGKVVMHSDAFYCSRIYLAYTLSSLGSGVMPILYYANRNKLGGCRFKCSLFDLFSWCCRKTGSFEL